MIKNILNEIQNMYNRGLSLSQISFYLNNKNKLNRGKKWTNTSISYYVNKELKSFKINNIKQFLPKIISKNTSDKKTVRNNKSMNQYSMRKRKSINYSEMNEINVDESFSIGKNKKRYLGNSKKNYSEDDSDIDIEIDSDSDSENDSENASESSNPKKRKINMNYNFSSRKRVYKK